MFIKVSRLRAQFVFLEAKGDELLCGFTSSDHFFVFKLVLHEKQQNIVGDKLTVSVVFFFGFGWYTKVLNHMALLCCRVTAITEDAVNIADEAVAGVQGSLGLCPAVIAGKFAYEHTPDWFPKTAFDEMAVAAVNCINASEYSLEFASWSMC